MSLEKYRKQAEMEADAMDDMRTADVRPQDHNKLVSTHLSQEIRGILYY